jgi:uncharacterized protein (TIGR02680 family)
VVNTTEPGGRPLPLPADAETEAERPVSFTVPPTHLHPQRYRLHRAGIRNVWQYDDQEFAFGDGRLLLRGMNGAGKSKALEMLLPYLLDGDARALDATGTSRTSLLWLMMDGYPNTNRLGYLWLEFRRDQSGEGPVPDSAPEFYTVGAAIRASNSTRSAKPYFFTTHLRVGHDLALVTAGQPLPVDRLREAVGADRVHERVVDHRDRVARDLFGLTDPARFRNLTRLLHRLRRPTIGDRIESGGIADVLGETLPMLDDDVVEKVARNLDDLAVIRTDLARLESTDVALREFLEGYRGYLHGNLRSRSDAVLAELDELRTRRRAAGAAETEGRRLGVAETELTQRLETLEEQRSAAEEELKALRESAGYRSLDELNERRRTLRALREAAQATYESVRTAQNAERGTAERVASGVERSGSTLRELATAHHEAVGRGERAGLDTGHLGSPVAGRTKPVASPPSRTLPAPDADAEAFEVEQPSVPAVDAMDTVHVADALGGWAGQLEAALPVVKERLRGVRELARELASALAARQAASQAEALSGQSAAQAEKARSTASGIAGLISEASVRYARLAAEWCGTVADRLPPGQSASSLEELLALDTSEDAPAELRGFDPEVGERLADAARDLLAPVLDSTDRELTEARAALRDRTVELERLQEEHRDLERSTEPEPTAPRFRRAARAPGTGAPFYRLVDFAPGVAPGAAEAAGIEAALEASGLLDAWVAADGSVLAPVADAPADSWDVLLDAATAGTLSPGAPSLGRVLRPVEVPGCGVPPGRVRLLLDSVALLGPDEPADPTSAPGGSAIGPDGRWRLGVASGRWAKDRAEYIGAELRAATRRRRLAELAERISHCRTACDAASTLVEELRRHAQTLQRLPLEVPRSSELRDLWARHAQAERSAESAQLEADRAEQEARAARSEAARLRHHAESLASTHRLPLAEADLTEARSALESLASDLPRLVRACGTARGELSDREADLHAHTGAVAARVDAEDRYARRRDGLRTAADTLRTLEETVGAQESELLAREGDAESRLRETQQVIPSARREAGAAHDAAVKAQLATETAREQLQHQEQETITVGAALRRALALPEVVHGAELTAGGGSPLSAPDPVEGTARDRIRALGELAEAVLAELGPVRKDITDTALVNRYTVLRDRLAGGYDAELREDADGIKLCRLIDDHGPQDVSRVAQLIAERAAEARGRLSEGEREVFNRFLLGELGDNLAEQMHAAGALVDTLNRTLHPVRTSHGLGVQLEWRLRDDADADIRAAVELLRSPAALRTREQSERLREVLQRRIEDARRADPSAGYAEHLRTALDYRAWFAFRPMVVDDAHPGRKRVLNARTGLSQGEQRVLSYLLLFASAAAHFTTLAESAPHAPRLILLDDAFAKVDEPTHDRLGRILVDLDLDFVLTSERLMGNWPDVPALHIYECLRDPKVRGVATLHYVWNGRNRRLVSV